VPKIDIDIKTLQVERLTSLGAVYCHVEIESDVDLSSIMVLREGNLINAEEDERITHTAGNPSSATPVVMVYLERLSSENLLDVAMLINLNREENGIAYILLSDAGEIGLLTCSVKG
jgi:hypothetical protein